MFNTILIGVIIGHIIGYREYYVKIGSSFVITYVLKKLIKCLDSDMADAFAVGGYAETVTCVMVLLLAIKQNGQAQKPPEGQEIIGGWMGKVVDKFIKH